jgi:DNA-directed RNA polymerase II subunit RPB3
MNGYHPNGSGPSHNGPSADQVQIPMGPTNQPRVLIRQLDNMNAVFNLSGVETGFANSLRRVIMADVPTICTCTSYIIILLILLILPFRIVV